MEKNLIIFMKQLNDYIIEKFKINSNTVNNNDFKDEELMDDYETVNMAFSKSEKKPFMDKYGVEINKIKDIQLDILNRLRENRQKKKEFNDEDVKFFMRFDIPWGKYDKAKEYLDKEPRDFLEYVLEYYEKKTKKIHPTRQSIADKYTLKIYNSLKKYLGK